MKRIFGWDSYELKTQDIELYVTQDGGHMAPVVFFPESDKPISPYYINPWKEEPHDSSLPILLQTLRGDFFCLPFGGNNKTESFDYPPHGPTANGRWKLKRRTRDSLSLEIIFPDGKAAVQTVYKSKKGNSCLYIENTVSGCDLKLPYGHHCILDSSSPLLLSSSPYSSAVVTDDSDKPYDNMEYHSLIGRRFFHDLCKAPSRISDFNCFDLTLFPDRLGYVDIVQIINDSAYGPIGWNAAACPEKGYLWYSMKRIEDFPTTLYWMENRGRHGRPWSSRNVCIGIEDALTCYADGAAVSSGDNDLSKAGVPTSFQFSSDTPKTLRIIEGVARISDGFNKVADIIVSSDRKNITFVDIHGKSVSSDVDVDFLS